MKMELPRDTLKRNETEFSIEDLFEKHVMAKAMNSLKGGCLKVMSRKVLVFKCFALTH